MKFCQEKKHFTPKAFTDPLLSHYDPVLHITMVSITDNVKMVSEYLTTTEIEHHLTTPPHENLL